ncbi:uncharacterized protein LOC128997865 [Macrosteles quadrilineatus]|uniref:uncharacterized protein LOC128997865 n=1 Tax=Macrosteles quadrilineatus TaxID=74068 RepID=UPI0023E0E1B8|nr:uncharacterized protein LOC128997865 [Macrosteles quadrilineatus]
MSFIGAIGPFDNSEETWDSYIERFELFVTCNDITDAKKVSTLLTVVGVKTYNLLKDLCTPDKPATKSYEDIVRIIKGHLHPKPSFIAERYKFSLRTQLDHESVADYIVNLKKLSVNCEFKDKLPDHLRDRIVSGLRDDATKKRLLGEEDLTFEKTVQIATSMELAARDTAALTYHNTGGGSRLHNVASKQHFCKRKGHLESACLMKKNNGEEINGHKV